MAETPKRISSRLRERKRVNYREEDSNTIDLLQFAGDIPHFAAAYRRDPDSTVVALVPNDVNDNKMDCDEDEFDEAIKSIGGEFEGVPILASLPVLDPANGDFKALTVYANEPDTIYEAKATNIMQDIPDYYKHCKEKSKEAEYPFVEAAIAEYKRIKKAERKKKKKKKMKAAKKFRKRIKMQDRHKLSCHDYAALKKIIMTVCFFHSFLLTVFFLFPLAISL